MGIEFGRIPRMLMALFPLRTQVFHIKTVLCGGLQIPLSNPI